MVKKYTMLTYTIICDLDGTLALHNNRIWNEYDKVLTDDVNNNIAELIRALKYGNGYRIIIISGREDWCKKDTKEWLEKNDIPFDELFMRKTKDYRKDCLIKKEIYEEYIKDNYNILFAIDDRNQVVDMWRKELNITCLQVNYGDF